MQRKNKILAIIVLVIISTLIITNVINNIPLNKETIPSEFVVGENMGFDLSPSRLNFGKIVPGYSASREITLENYFNEPIIISIESSGEISDSIIVSENYFILSPGESKKVAFTAFADLTKEYGTYSGEIIIISKKA